jgi:putative RNA 2'-phosphotransferase
MTAALTDKSKYLSYLLRHKPEAARLTLDKEGWCRVDQLLANTDITEAELLQIVAEDTKGRYSFDAFATSVRANQGHSTKDVRLSFKSAVPPTVLYHGTADSAVDSIMKSGLVPMNRHHVHLSADLDTAQVVGGRRKKGTVIFEVDTKTMLANGYKFFLSENGVWLVDAVPPPFLKVLHD